MKNIHNWKNIIVSRLAMLALLIAGGVSAASADTKLSVEDISIAAGETKSVSVSLDTDETNIFLVSVDFSLPEGLEFVTKSANSTSISVTRNTERASGDFTVSGSTNTYRIALTSLSMNTITGTTGSIFTFKVKATEDIYGLSTIEVTDYTIKKTNGEDVTATIKNGKVSKTNTADEGQIALAFNPSTLTLAPGATASVEVTMDNPGCEVEGMQVDLDIPAGWSYTITNGRLVNENPNNGTNNRVISTTDIEGESGTIFTLNLTAPATFSGSAVIGLNNIRPTVGGETLAGVENANLVVTADGNAPIVGAATVFFAEDMLALEPYQTKSVAVNMDNLGIEVEGMQANIEVPDGWSFTLTNGRVTNTNPNDGSSTRVVTYSIIEGESGSIFTLNLTAPANFTSGTAVARIVNIRATINSRTVVLDPISIILKANNPADLATVMNWIHGLQQKLDNTIAKIEEEYPEAANDQTIIREEQVIQQGIYDLDSDVQEAYEKGELNPADFRGDVEELSDAIDALEYRAKEIQDNAVNEDNEAGYAKLLDELDDLRQMLEDAYAKRPADLPKTAKDAFKDTHDDIDDDIDDLEDAVDAAYAAEELTPNSELNPEDVKAIIDAIKALEAEILTWLRGDVAQNQVVEMPDFYALADSILNENLPTDKEGNAFYRFDANADEEINVGDMQGIVNIVLGMDAYGNAARQAEAVEASLSVETMKIGNITRYTLNLTGMEYTAFQMDVNGRVAAESAEGMTLRTADLKSGSHRVLGFGTAKTDGTVLCIDVEGQAQFSNIVFTTASAQTVKFNLGTTGIASVKAAAENGQAYDLNGRAVKNAKGVVIVDGKKVIR